MASYLILIYADEAQWAAADEQTISGIHAAHSSFFAANGAAISGGNALEGTASATAIRTDPSGDVTVTDGPFVETKEALGGYYLIEAADLDEAIAVARQVPARFGGVEIRPVRVLD